jgi:N-acyl-D-aspartate/D-glutamate deacylase
MTHHKAIFPENWGKPAETMRLIDRARQRGVEIICDFYPWEHASEGNLGGLFLPYFLSPQASPDELKLAMENLVQAIEDPVLWEKIKKFNLESFEKEETANETRKKELKKRGVVAPNLWDPETSNFVVYSRCHPELFGKNLREVTRLLGMDDYQEAARRLYLEDNRESLLALGWMCEEDILTVLRHPASAITTDGAAYDEKQDLCDPLAWAHPRNYGTYAKVLQRYVREMKVLQLEEAVRKMTSLPLGFLGIRDRGLVKEGMWADLTVFNPETITNHATSAKPCSYPEGIEHVLVNGVVAIQNGQHTGALSGRVLRRA